VAFSLTHAIKEYGHEIRMILPKYGMIRDRQYTLRDVIRLRDLEVPLGDQKVLVNVKSAFYPGSKIQVYFVDYPPYFGRPGLYVDPKTGKDYEDNAERFALFCHTAFAVLERLHWYPDVIHCNDWQTALIPPLLKEVYGKEGPLAKTKTLLTVHNFAYQGVFPKEKFRYTGLPAHFAEEDGAAAYYGKISYLKAGLEYADVITTVSPTYARQAQEDPEIGAGMQEILRRRAQDFYGILNGVDYSTWDPSSDKEIPVNYTFRSIDRKMENKKFLLEFCNMPFEPEIPFVGTISRLVVQKGFDILLEALPVILEKDLRYIILGVGDKEIEKKLKSLQQRFPEKLFVHIGFDERLAHLIEAGCDLFLMPSRYEPCGLNQLYSLRYGTIPIVRGTGGLLDTVVDVDENPQKGTGFVFKKYDAKELVQTVERALKWYQDRASWRKLVVRAMKQDFSWKNSAKEYIRLYQQLAKMK